MRNVPDQSVTGESPMIAGLTPMVERLDAIRELLAQNHQQMLTMAQAQATYTPGASQQQPAPPPPASALAGQTQMPPGHVPGSGAPQPVPAAGPAPAPPGVGAGPQPIPVPAPGAPIQPSPVPVGPGGGPGGGGGTGGGGGGGGGGSQGQPLPPPTPGQPQGQPAPGGQGNPNDPNGNYRGRGLVGNILQATAEAVKIGLNFNDQARNYQYMEAGTRGEGLAERGREDLYAARQLKNRLNAWTAGEARQAFVDATAMGFGQYNGGSGPSRDQVLSFMSNQASRNGMSESQSAALVTTAINNSQVNLNDLSEAITNVGNAARQAGVSTQAAYDHFQQYLSAMNTTLGGPGASRTAGQLAAGQVSMGRAFMNTDMSAAINNPTYQYQAAAMSNMTAGQFQNSLRNGDGRAMGAISRMNTQLTDQMIPPEWRTFIQQQIQAEGGKEALLKDPDRAGSIGQAWLDQFQGDTRADLNVLSQSISAQTGIPVQPAQVPEWLVNSVAGISAFNRDNYTKGSGRSVDAQGNYVGTKDKATGADATALTRGSELGIAPGSTPAAGTAGVHNKATEAYQAMSGKMGGHREPVIEALLARVKDPDNTMVSVSVKGGKRVMSLTEAIQTVPNAVVAGDIQFLSGKTTDADGKTVDAQGLSFEDVAGMAGRRDKANEIKERQTGAGSNKGTDYDQYLKDHPEAKPDDKDKDSGGQNVVIKFTGKAERWLEQVLGGKDDPPKTPSAPSDGASYTKRMGDQATQNFAGG